MYKTSVYTLVNGDMQWVTHRKPPYSPEVDFFPCHVTTIMGYDENETKVNKNHTNKKVIKIISICSLNDWMSLHE